MSSLFASDPIPRINQAVAYSQPLNPQDTAAASGKQLFLAAAQVKANSTSPHADVRSIQLFLLLFKSAQQHFWSAIQDQETAMAGMSDLQSVLTILRNAERGKDADAKISEADKNTVLETSITAAANSSMKQAPIDFAALKEQKAQLEKDIQYLRWQRGDLQSQIDAMSIYSYDSIFNTQKFQHLKSLEKELHRISDAIPGYEHDLHDVNAQLARHDGSFTVSDVLDAYSIGAKLRDFRTLPALQKLTETLNSEVEARNRDSQLKMLKVNEWQSVVHEYSTFASEQISKSHDAKLSIAHNWM